MPANKNQLQAALQKPYDRILFSKDVLRSVFGSGFVLNNTPVAAAEQPNKSEKAVIDSVYVYGTIKLEDDKEITCYEINLQSSVRIEQSKVAIQKYVRKLLTTGQGALVNFISPQNKQVWRFTLIAKDSEMSEEGVKEKITNAKRYTYLLGPSESCKTAAERLEALSNNAKGINLESLTDAFSVEKLNKDFYKDISEQFYKLVGATAGKGKNVKTYERLLKLPGIKADANRIYHEFAVRLIGRTVFCWFLKVKKSEANLALLPEHLLSSKAVKENPNYYHMVLEKLFFQTLNTPSKDRIKDLPKGCEHIPFLNGGLFEADAEDYYKPNKITGLSGNINTLVIPDSWFTDFFEKLEQYNFTIDENSMTDIQVSVDPEMLGSIFENLLAEIDPDSGETARKATGSFYTPREIVDYMVAESLSYYLNNVTAIEKDRLDSLFKPEEDISFSPEEKEKILIALDKVKILDPACGSGAFPMGVLHKLVLALQKLDSEAEWWIKQQVDKSKDPKGKSALQEKLRKNFDYARKIGIIQNNLYGVDIQPIAAEISKLRSFLTLIVDEHIDDGQPNRGIEPLPNLEFKFVTADTLMKLPAEGDYGGLFNSNDDLDQLQQLRVDYLQSYGEHKSQLKQQFVELQKSIFKQQLGFAAGENNRAFKISNWNPFGHAKTDWFEPEWMFGVKEFDIVTGNPPYVDIKNLPKDQVKDIFKNYKTAENRINLYSVFIERSKNLLNSAGILCFINPNSILVNESYKKIRNYILDEVSVIIKLPDSVFKAAVVETIIILLSKHKPKNTISAKYFKKDDKIDFANLEFSSFQRKNWKEDSENRFNIFLDGKANVIIKKIEENCTPLKDLVDFSLGITPYDKYKGHSEQLINDRAFHSNKKISKEYVPLISGKNIHSYYISDDVDEYLKYGDWLGAPREKRFFESEKIVVRQILSGKQLDIVAGYSNRPTYFTQIGFSLVSKSETISLKYILALMNSRLMSYYHKEKFLDKEKNTFQKILIANCKLFPIKASSKEMHAKIIKLVDSFIKKEGQERIEKDILNILVYKVYGLSFDEAILIDPNIDEQQWNIL